MPLPIARALGGFCFLCGLLLAAELTGPTAVSAQEAASVSKDRPPSVPPEVDFRRDIVPLLTRRGCNGGGCHGKSTGRGGLKLSLFGFEPAEDYRVLARGSRGRRIFPADPDRSLLLQKATMAISHGGGKRLARGEPEYDILRRWIAANTPWGDDRAATLVSLRIDPAERVLKPGQSERFRVLARFADGQTLDVTRITRFRSSDPSLLEVAADGTARAERRVGGAAVIAQFLDSTALATVIMPHPRSPAKFPLPDARNWIDRLVFARLKEIGAPPSPLIGDLAFLRRATLRIAGRIPTAEEVDAFEANADPKKREQLIDRLLDSSDYADHFGQKWASILRNKRRGQAARIPGTLAFHRWLRNHLAANTPYDRIVREILTATGDVSSNPPAQWYAEVRYQDRMVDDMAQVFLGVRIGCARCHHHPYEKFSQEDYFGLAAFFARVGRKGGAGVAERRANETVFIQPTGTVKHPGTGKIVAPRGLGGKPLKIAAYEDPRERLVDWMTEADNPYFARAAVNRLWAHCFGRGLVAPHDDLRDSNPPANGQLLDALAAEFVRSGYDLKQLLRTICTSATFQLDSRSNEFNLEETQNHSRFYPERLTAEVLLDSIDLATGVATRYSGLPAGYRAVQLPDEGYSNTFLKLFGRPPRESACECERVAAPSLSQSLFVMNNGFLNAKVNHRTGFAAELAADKSPLADRVRRLFRRCLTRNPTETETAAAVAHLKASGTKSGFADLVWTLVNTKEFLFVH